jgi:hypothetical protein
MRVVKLWAAAFASAAISLLVEWRLQLASPVLRGVVILVPFGVAYVVITHLLGLSGAMSSVLARLGLKRG